MASLTIRNIPESVLKMMRQTAKQEHRSLNSQALEWLEQSAQRQQSNGDLGDLLKSIATNREAMYRKYGPGTDSVKLLRAMRRRVR